MKGPVEKIICEFFGKQITKLPYSAAPKIFIDSGGCCNTYTNGAS